MITVLPDPGRAGTAQLRFANATAAAGSPLLRIRREGWDQGTLGPNGWQGEDALLTPDEVATDGADLVLTVGWAVCSHLEAGTYTVGIPSAGIAEAASWPNIRPVRTGARPRPAPPVTVAAAPPPAPTIASVAPLPPPPPPARVLAPPPLPVARPQPTRRGNEGKLIAVIVFLALLIAGAGGYWYGTTPGRPTFAALTPPGAPTPATAGPAAPAPTPPTAPVSAPMPAPPAARPPVPSLAPPPAPVSAPMPATPLAPSPVPLPQPAPPATYAESLLCGRFVQYRSMPSADFLGVWSGTWNNGRLCGGLVVEGRSDTSADVSYVYSLTGPSQTPHFLHGVASVDGDSLRFSDDQGGHFTFMLTGDGQTLFGRFLDPRNHELTTTFRRK